MLKKERLMSILKLVDQNEIVTGNELVETLNVSDMTIRRDLDELSKSGKLIRIHGGAQSISDGGKEELSRNEKRELHLKEKEEVAKKAASMIESGETIYLGPGTTNELIAKYVDDVSSLRIVTNSLPVFEGWNVKDGVEVVLIGGTYRERSGAFIGGLTNSVIDRLKFTKAFVGVNGIHDERMMTANTEEGQAQLAALNNAGLKLAVCDYHKLNRDDFYCFYNLYNLDALITNKQASSGSLRHYQEYTKIILAEDSYG